MTHYMVERWTALRLQWVTVLMATVAGMLGVLFSHPDRRPLAPSFVGVGVIACLRLSRVLPTLCRHSTKFNTQWMPVQRLMELLRLPVERLTVCGKAQLGSHTSLVPQLRDGLTTDAFDQDVTTLIRFVSTPSQDEIKALTEDCAGRRVPSGVSDASCSPGMGPTTRQRGSPVLHAGSRSHTSSDAVNVMLPALELVQVSARYRRSLPLALNRMDLVVYPRERLGIIGPSGHGKSTIFNVLLRLLDDLVDGGVYVNGEDIDFVPYPILRSNFAVVPEEPVVVDGTWRENLLFGYHPLSPFDRRRNDSPWLLPLPTQFVKPSPTTATTTASPSPPAKSERAPLATGATAQYGATGRRDDGDEDDVAGDEMVFGNSQPQTSPQSHQAPYRSSRGGAAAPPCAPRHSHGSGLPQGPLQHAEDAALWAALSAVGLQQVAAFDGGLDADMASGDMADIEWSLSQRRLLCMARALVHKPPILLIEDAYTGSTDAECDAIMARLLRDELKDSTVLFIGHRQRVVCELCTRVVIVEHGRVSKTIEPRLSEDTTPIPGAAQEAVSHGRVETVRSASERAKAVSLRFSDEAKRDILQITE